MLDADPSAPPPGYTAPANPATPEEIRRLCVLYGCWAELFDNREYGIHRHDDPDCVGFIESRRGVHHWIRKLGILRAEGKI